MSEPRPNAQATAARNAHFREGSAREGSAQEAKARAAGPLVAEAPLGLRRAETASPAARRRGGGRLLASLDASLRRLARPLASAFREPPGARREPRLRID